MASNTLTQLSKSWQRLDAGQRKVVTALAIADAVGKAIALRSLARTPKDKVRGPKFVWAPVIASVNTLGWLAWFLAGKKK